MDRAGLSDLERKGWRRAIFEAWRMCENLVAEIFTTRKDMTFTLSGDFVGD